MSKGSADRTANREKFNENFDKIFQPKVARQPGRRYYRQVPGQGMVEVEPPPPMPSDLRVDSPFISPVDGSLIRNKRELLAHNARNGVEQATDGHLQDWSDQQKQRDNFYNSKEQKQKRVETLKASIEKLGG